MSAPETKDTPPAAEATPQPAEAKPVPPLPAGETSEEAPAKSSPNSPGRRLSVLISKARKSVTTAAERLASPDKEHPPKKASGDSASKVDEVPKAEEEAPKAEASATATADKPAEEPAAAAEKTEKRKSRLLFDNFFHRKSPAKEDEKPADEAHAEAAQAKEAPAPATATAEPSAESAAPVPPPKDTPKEQHPNVIDQIKRNAIVNKFFGHKKTEKNGEAEATAATTEAKPDDAPQPQESTSAEKKPATTQLGRRLTKLLHSVSTKRGKKSGSSTSSSSSASSKHKDETPEAPKAEAAAPAVQDQQIHPAAASTTTPTVQATA
ncbi:hypothetical protein BJV82DRAFT_589854 [Fennellomyces sp. T-0311]|nr:hypothetical protein BJV82DRAFT_589854 [Fennellomyces sp. T-0311]